MTRKPHLVTRLLSLPVVAAVAVTAPACGDVGSRGNDRWVTTENTNVDIDWDAVGKAYREAEGPEDFERRVNEIYAGDEVVSVSVRDIDERTQRVTGFFDENTNGKVEEAEKVFTIEREIGAEQQDGHYRIHGYGPYAGYRSPMWDIAAGMVMGSFLARAFSPGYAPMYSRPYVTSPSRRADLVTHRNSYRQANPKKFQKRSRSGRTYGKKGRGFGGGRATPSRAPRPRGFGGGRFGIRRPAGRKVVRLG